MWRRRERCGGGKEKGKEIWGGGREGGYEHLSWGINCNMHDPPPPLPTTHTSRPVATVAPYLPKASLPQHFDKLEVLKFELLHRLGGALLGVGAGRDEGRGLGGGVIEGYTLEHIWR